MKKEERLKKAILSDINKGWDSHRIAKKHKVSWQTVAAYKAHITMGNI